MMSGTKRNVLALLAGAALVGFIAPMAHAQSGSKEAKVQQKGDKAAAEIGAPAPTFSLKDTEGKTHNLADLKGKVVVLEWFNADCPYVKKHHTSNKTMSDLNAKYKDKGVVWLAVNSNVAGTQGAGIDRNTDARKEMNIAYPILLDDNAKVSRMYGAKTTPHMYIIDQNGVLVYAGGIDNNPSPNKLGDINYVDQALQQVINKETVTEPTSKPYGCGVKYPKS